MKDYTTKTPKKVIQINHKELRSRTGTFSGKHYLWYTKARLMGYYRWPIK